MATDRAALRSGVLPAEVFDRRFSDENLAFWAPRLIAAAGIGEGDEVLDVGCGTGGFSREIASRASAAVTGLDEAGHFVERARRARPRRSAVRWVVGDAADLPFAASSFDRVILSLVLHQLPDPAAAVSEASRVVRGGGVVLVRTVAPEDACDRVPQRYVPSMAAADAARLPSIRQVRRWLADSGLAEIKAVAHLRNKRLDVDEEERSLRAEVAGRFIFVAAGELEAGVRRMRDEARLRGPVWVDPRPTYIITARKRR